MAISEIEFRGKTASEDKWVYGWFTGIFQTEDGDVGCIKDYTGKDNLTKAETIGQYIGRKDKNGNEIFDGDIVKHSIHYINRNEDKEYISIVKWNQERCAFVLNHINGTIGFSYLTADNEVEVIGNLYDNPELLGVKK